MTHGQADLNHHQRSEVRRPKAESGVRSVCNMHECKENLDVMRQK